MKSVPYHFFVLAFLAISGVMAQENLKLDSLLQVYGKQRESIEKVKTIQELFYAEMYNTPEKAKAYANEAVAMSKRIKYETGVGVGYYHLGSFYQVLLQIDSARHYYQKSASFWKKNGDRERLASTVSSMGMLEQLDGNYATALEMLNEAIQMYKEVGNISHMTNNIGTKALVHIDQGNYRLALLDALECLRLRDSLKTKPWRKADALRQVGRVEYYLENHKSAINHFEQASAIYDSIKDNVYLGHTYTDIGLSYYESDDFENAIKYYDKSLAIAESLEIRDMQENAWANLGMVYSRLGQHDRGIALLEKALSKDGKQNSLINYVSNLTELGQA